jgi:hypothetical protein
MVVSKANRPHTHSIYESCLKNGKLVVTVLKLLLNAYKQKKLYKNHYKKHVVLADKTE